MPDISEKQMIYESYLAIKGLEKRIDRHGAEHREDMDKLWVEMKKVTESHSELSVDHGTRLTKLETERGTLSKIISFLIATGAGGFSGWWGGKHL